MTYTEMESKVLALIEEANPNANIPEISAKIRKVANRIMHELARIRNVAKHVEAAVGKEELAKVADKSKGEVYKVGKKDGAKHVEKADGKPHKVAEEKAAEIEKAPKPKPISPKKAKENQTIELDEDALTVMPYGIAAELLKYDDIAGFGEIYAMDYDDLLQQLDPRNAAKDGKPKPKPKPEPAPKPEPKPKP